MPLVGPARRFVMQMRDVPEQDIGFFDIALQAGFGSLRRFNSVFAEVYGRPPTEIRRKKFSGAAVLA